MSVDSRMLVGVGLCAMALNACVESVDLRSSHGGSSPPCADGYRADPATDLCAACVVEPVPDAAMCPCGYVSSAAEFPYCEGNAVRHDCVACTGDVTSCRVFDAAQHATQDCGLLEQCCNALAADGGKRCCPLGADMVCVIDANLGEYRLSCIEPTCCSGTTCANGDSDCASWQVCSLPAGLCVPACRPQAQVCCAECGCECVDLDNPP